MLRWVRGWVVVLAAITLAPLGCDDASGGSGGEPDSGGIRDANLADAGPTRDRGLPPDVGGEPDAALPDASGPRTVETCDDACRVYETCDRLDLWNDDAAACASGCAEAEGARLFGDWLGCLATEACESLEICRVPAPPEPSCADVCAAAEACGADARLDEVLEGSCADECGAGAIPSRRLLDCGAPVLAAAGAGQACDADAFAHCLVLDLQPDCAEMCATLSECELNDDPIACTLACAAVSGDPDPVVVRRGAQRQGCIAATGGNCDGAAACYQIFQPAEVDPEAVGQICAADEACGFFDAESCEADVGGLLGRLAPGASECFAAHLGESCEGPYRCFEPAPAPESGCDELCAVSTLCEVLPGGQTEFECMESCQSTLAGDDAAARAELTPRFPCAFLGDCPSIQTCLEEAAPGPRCQTICAREAECGGAEEAAACAARCEAGFNTHRVRAEMACVEAASSCDWVLRCLPPPAPDCSLLCDPLAACELASPRCLLECDNHHFAAPGDFLEQVACLVSTARCDARAACQADPAGGRPCLAWCRYDTACLDPQPDADLIECARACGAGLEGRAGLRFAGAAACLGALAGDADCDALAACDDLAADAHCAAVCGELQRCELDDDEAACLATCQGLTEDDDYLAQAACTLNAERRSDGCRAIADCNGVEVVPASPACMSLCGTRHGCDEDLDAFLCERQCIPEPEGAPVQAACAERGGCEALDQCLAAEAAVPAPCAAACGLFGECVGVIAEGPDALFPDLARCEAACAGAAVLEGEAYPGDVQACAEGVRMNRCNPEAAAECFDPEDPICEASWAAIVVCGIDMFFMGGEAQYLMDCAAALTMDEAATRMQAQCVIDLAAQGDAFACLLGAAQCFL